MRSEPIQGSVEDFLSGFSQELNTCIPGYIESYDPATKTATAIVPFVDYFENDDGTADERKWSPVPGYVLFARGGGWSITFPLKKGDPVLVVFSQRSIDEWAASDGKTEVSPQEIDNHSSSDAFIIAGLFPEKNADGKANGDDLILSHIDGTELRLGKDKKIHAVCDRLNIGADNASTALAKASTTDDRLSALEAKYNEVVTVSAASGGFLPPGTITPIIPGSSTASGKAFTND
jgi:hypothetical protein